MHVPGVVLCQLYDGCLGEPAEVLRLENVVVGDNKLDALVNQPREPVLDTDLQHPAGVLAAGVVLQELYAELHQRRHVEANTHVKDRQHIVAGDLRDTAVHELQHGLKGRGFHVSDVHLTRGAFGKVTTEHAVQGARPCGDDVPVRHEPLLRTILALSHHEDDVGQALVPVELGHALRHLVRAGEGNGPVMRGSVGHGMGAAPPRAGPSCTT
mmetsp:Transcript_99228/g.305911  ORF Transcript_99228/g.305911 Transcript_99228/m.305911 type:complete len:212 (+) Transcript_99228:1331-1966(+)